MSNSPTPNLPVGPANTNTPNPPNVDQTPQAQSTVPTTDQTPAAPGPTTAPLTAAAPAAGTAAGMGGAAPTVGQRVGQDSKHVLGEIFQTLAGGQKKVWQQTPNGPVATYQDLKPGEMARGILAAAITGLAGGYDPANRGKGPAMSAAFSGGFKANKERVEKKEADEAAEAQKQFQNEGASQERLLAAHRDALAQQESIRSAQKHDLDMQVLRDQLSRGERLDAEHIADRDALDSQKLIDAKNTGATIVNGPDGKPLEFKSDHDLMMYIQDSKANAERVFGTSDMFNTERLRDPAPGMIYVYKRPIDDHTPRWMGVIVDKDGHPVLKDGEMQIDKSNPWYDASGKARVPATKMTPGDFKADLRASEQLRSEKLRDSLTSIQRDNAFEEYKQRMKNDNAQQLAEKHLTEAGDDLDSPVLTADDKNYLRNTNAHVASSASVLLASLEKDIAAEEAAGTPKNDPGLMSLRKKKDAVVDALDKATSYDQMLSKSGTQAIIDYQRRKNGDDIDTIKKEISNLPEAQQKIVIDGVKKPKLPDDTRLQRAITEYLNPMAAADRAAAIASFPEKNPGDRNLLYKHYGLTPPPEKEKPAEAAPTTVPGASAANAVVQSLANSGIAGGGPAPASVPGASLVNKVLGQ